MYLSRPQYTAIVSCNVGKHDEVAPEIIKHFLQHGLIIETLIGYELTELGTKSMQESRAEHERQEADNRTGPADKHDRMSNPRTKFTNEDDLTIPPKRRTSENRMVKTKPQTKYKDLK